MCCLAVRRTSVFLILFAFCGSLVPSMGQPMNTASGSNTTILGQIPQPMKRFIAHQTVAGTVTLVAHGGNVVEFHALGMADRRGVRSQRSAALHEDLSAQEYKVLCQTSPLFAELIWPRTRCSLPAYLSLRL